MRSRANSAVGVEIVAAADRCKQDCLRTLGGASEALLRHFLYVADVAIWRTMAGGEWVRAFPGLGFKKVSGQESLRHSAVACYSNVDLEYVRGILASVIVIQRMACADGGNRVLYSITMDGMFVRALASTPPAYWRRTFLLNIVQLTFNWLHDGRDLWLCPTRLRPRSCSEGCERLTSLHSWCGGRGAADWAGRV